MRFETDESSSEREREREREREANAIEEQSFLESYLIVNE
jgi:hypothetical protein